MTHFCIVTSVMLMSSYEESVKKTNGLFWKYIRREEAISQRCLTRREELWETLEAWQKRSIWRRRPQRSDSILEMKRKPEKPVAFCSHPMKRGREACLSCLKAREERREKLNEEKAKREAWKLFSEDRSWKRHRRSGAALRRWKKKRFSVKLAWNQPESSSASAKAGGAAHRRSHRAKTSLCWNA